MRVHWTNTAFHHLVAIHDYAAANVTSYSASEMRVIADGEVAVVTNLAAMSWATAEGVRQRRTTRVWRKEEGRWRVVHMQTNDVVAATGSR